MGKNKKISLIVLTLVLFYYVGFSLIRGTTANEVPANPAFDDMAFYQCVIDEYNDKTGELLDYTVNLTDEQLETIDSLSCSSYDGDELVISSLKGLEKLINLVNLSLYSNSIEEIDLSNLINLVDLYVSSNSLNEINMNGLSNLTDLYLVSNSIKEIDLSDLIELDDLSINANFLKEIDLSKNDKLSYLNINASNLNGIDLSNNNELNSLSVMSNKIMEINLDNLNELSSLYFYAPELNELDVSNNDKLISLILFKSKVSELDLSNNLELQSLVASSNKISFLVLPSSDSLITLDLSDNLISEVDISNYINLDYLDLSNNLLTEIDLSKNLVLTEVNLFNNNIESIDLTGLDYIENLNVEYNVDEDVVIPNLSNITDLTISIDELDDFDTTKYENLTSLSIVDYKNVNVYGNNVTEDYLVNTIPTNVNYSDYVIFYNFGNLYLNVIEYLLLEQETDKVINENNVVIYADASNIGEAINFSGDVLYLGYREIMYENISSDKYIINDISNYIYTGTDDFDINEINVTSYFDTVVDTENDKILIMLGDELIKEYNIISIGFGDLSLDGDNVIMLDDITYADIISNISMSDEVSYKILNGNEEVDTNTILTEGMKINFYYNDDYLLDSYFIGQELFTLLFDENLVIDNQNKYIKELTIDTLVSDILNNVSSLSGDIKIVDKDNNIKDNNDILATGDKLVVLSGVEKKDEYILSIVGDSNGDGKVSSVDLVQLRKHVVEYKNPNTGIIELQTGVYKDAIDLSGDGIINSLDVVIMRKKIVGLE